MAEELPESTRDRLVRWGRIARQIPQVFAMVYRAHPMGAITIPILTVLTGPLPALQLYFMKRLIDGVALWQQNDPTGSHVVYLFGGLTIGIGLARSLLGRVVSGFERLLRFRLSNYLQEQLMGHTMTLDLESFESPAFYDSLQRARREAGARPYQIVSALIRGASDAITMLSFMVVLAMLSWWLVPFITLMVIPSLVTQVKFGRLGWRMNWSRTPEERRMRYLQDFLSNDQSAKEVRLFGLAGHLLRQWRVLIDKFYAQDRAIVLREGAWDTGVLIFQSLGTAAYYSYVTFRTVTDPSVTIGSLVMYFQTMDRAQGSLQSVVSSVAMLYENALYLDNLFRFFEHKPSIVAPANPLPVPAPIRRGIELKDVVFQYPNSNRVVLDGITMKIGAGERIALVGENGAGKTTLIKILARLYDPQSGSVSVDGIDLRRIDPAAWRDQIAIIFQDFGRYHVTARENVGYGRVEHVDDMDRIRAAAEMSGATESIDRLDDKWETILGKVFNKGHDLSLGEWQKIALARAFFRDAPILVLDEPTASLDAKQEYELFARFQELTAGKTTVLISHRFSTVRMADRIFVIEHGKIVEVGNHHELMDLQGRYADLFERQAKSYR